MTNKSIHHLITITLISIVLAGCSLTPKQAEEPSFDWAFTGRMSISDGQQASSFTVEWQQTALDFDIELYGPFGQGRTSITGTPEQVILTQGTQYWIADSLSQLALELTEMQLPLDYLQYWVRALPEPNSRATQKHNDLGQVISIEQAGWLVEFSEYHPQMQQLPSRLNFQRENRRGRLVIRDWTLIQSTAHIID